MRIKSFPRVRVCRTGWPEEERAWMWRVRLTWCDSFHGFSSSQQEALIEGLSKLKEVRKSLEKDRV